MTTRKRRKFTEQFKADAVQLVLVGGKTIAEVTKQICDIVDGPVSAEVVATEYKEMMREAKILAKIADNVCIKVPLTLDGLERGMRLLSK